MANLPWEAPSHWVRPNKTADDIGKTYGVIYINNVNRNFKNNAAYAILYQKQFTKYLLPDLLKDSQNYMYLHANSGDKQGPFMHTSTVILQIFVQIGLRLLSQ